MNSLATGPGSIALLMSGPHTAGDSSVAPVEFAAENGGRKTRLRSGEIRREKVRELPSICEEHPESSP